MNEITKPQIAILKTTGGIAYIDADVNVQTPDGKLTGVDAISYLADNNEWLKVSATRKMKTHQIADIMSPQELEEERKHQKGWYVKGDYWYTKFGDKAEMTWQAKQKPEYLVKKMENKLNILRMKKKNGEITKEEMVEAKSLLTAMKNLKQKM